MLRVGLSNDACLRAISLRRYRPCYCLSCETLTARNVVLAQGRTGLRLPNLYIAGRSGDGREPHMPHRILVVEDHPLFSDALIATLRAWQEDVRARSARTLAEGLEVVLHSPRLDMVILDLWLPDNQGFDGILQMRRAAHHLPILICSAFADSYTVEKCLVCGAAGVVAKSSSSATIIRGVEAVLSGERSFALTNLQPMNADTPEFGIRLKRLTQKQLRVLQKLCEGKLNKQIAYELAVSEQAIKAHVTEILRKLDVQSRTHAVVEMTKLSPPVAAGMGTCEARANVVESANRHGAVDA